MQPTGSLMSGEMFGANQFATAVATSVGGSWWCFCDRSCVRHDNLLPFMGRDVVFLRSLDSVVKVRSWIFSFSPRPLEIFPGHCGGEQRHCNSPPDKGAFS